MLSTNSTILSVLYHKPKFLFSSGTMQYTASLLGWGVTENNGAFRFHYRISVNASFLSTTCLACIGIGIGRRLVISLPAL